MKVEKLTYSLRSLYWTGSVVLNYSCIIDQMIFRNDAYSVFMYWLLMTIQILEAHLFE